MPSDDKPVEHLKAKPYDPLDRRGKKQAQQQSQQQGQQQGAKMFFVRHGHANLGGRRNPLLGYLLLFLLTALLATAFLFGFIVLLVLFAVLLPIWIVVRFLRGRGTP